MSKRIKLLLLIIIVLLISGCINGYNSTSLTSDGFARKMKNLDFKLENNITEYEKNKEIVHAYKATEKDDKFTIEFLEFSSSKKANSYFTKEREDLTNNRDENSVFNYSVVDNKEKYTLNTNDNHYIGLTIIDNTILKFNVDSKYSEEIITLTERELGY